MGGVTSDCDFGALITVRTNTLGIECSVITWLTCHSFLSVCVHSSATYNALDGSCFNETLGNGSLFQYHDFQIILIETRGPHVFNYVDITHSILDLGFRGKCVPCLRLTIAQNSTLWPVLGWYKVSLLDPNWPKVELHPLWGMTCCTSALFWEVQSTKVSQWTNWHFLSDLLGAFSASSFKSAAVPPINGPQLSTGVCHMEYLSLFQGCLFS